jgi:hypothetical protein
MKAFFKAIWNGWKKFAEVLGLVVMTVLFTVLYFVLLPFWNLMRFGDPLRKRLRGRTYWEPYKNSPAELDRFQRPF